MKHCTICGAAFDTIGGHCPACVAKASAERAKLQAEADRRNAIHVWRVNQERRQAREAFGRVEWKEAV